MIELQANFVTSEDLETIMKVSGNIQAGTTASYSDDGVSQKTTIKKWRTESGCDCSESGKTCSLSYIFGS